MTTTHDGRPTDDGVPPHDDRAARAGGAAAPPRTGWSPARTVALVLALVLVVPAAAYGGLWWLLAPRPVVTTAVGPAGDRVELHWAEHPGQAGTTVDEVLAAPSLEEGVDGAEAMVAEMKEAVSGRAGLRWGAPPAVQVEQGTVFPSENGWGGPSLLRTVNLPAEQTTSVPRSWAEKQAVIDAIGEVSARHGWSEPALDEERWPRPEAERVRDPGGATPAEQVLVTGMVTGPHGQWLEFTFTDLSKDDAEGTVAERLSVSTDAGWEPESVTLAYGANGLLPAADRAEFERRAAPFAGQPLPDAQED